MSNALDRFINIFVNNKEANQSLDKTTQSLNKVDASTTKVTQATKNLNKETQSTTAAIVKNGGAMGLLNDLTGGMAMGFKDASEAMELAGVSLNSFKGIMLATGIGALVLAIGYLAENWKEAASALGLYNAEAAQIKDITNQNNKEYNKSVANVDALVEALNRALGVGRNVKEAFDELAKAVPELAKLDITKAFDLDYIKRYIDEYGKLSEINNVLKSEQAGLEIFQNLFLWLNNRTVQYFTQLVLLNGNTGISDDMDNPGFLVEDYISFNYTDSYVEINLPAGGFEGVYPLQVHIKTDVTNTSNSTTKYKIIARNYDTNEILNIGPELQGDVDPGYTNDFNLTSKPTPYSIRIKFETEVDGSLNFDFVTYIDLSYTTSFAVGIMSSNNAQSVIFGQNVSNNITNMKVVDFIQGLMKAFKLIIRPITPTIFYLNTLDGYYGDGNILDVTPYIDQKTVKIERPVIYRDLKFKFQKTNNVAGKKFRKTYDPVNDEIGYGDLQATYETIDNKEELSIDLPFENMMFDRLLSGNTTSLTNILIGQSISLGDDNATLSPNNSKPIMFYHNGLIDISNSPIKFKWPIGGGDYNYYTLYNIPQVANTNDELLLQVTDAVNWWWWSNCKTTISKSWIDCSTT